MKTVFSFLLFLLFSFGAVAQSPAPPMGWNSWGFLSKNEINEQIVKDVIDSLAEHGFQDLGYEYIVVDGGWRDTALGPNGELVAHPVKFPHGMKALADYAHAKGFKFGLHTVPGTHDCGCDPVGGWGNERVQAQQFADWGVDFIKLDKCRFTFDPAPDFPRNDPRWKEGWNKRNGNEEKAYTLWSRLLKEKGIVLSASAYAFHDWYPKLTSMGRTTGDIKCFQTDGAVFDNGVYKNSARMSVMDIALRNETLHEHAGNGYWNDPDLVVTGNQGLTQAEQEAHFALWCIMSAPLMLGNDPRNMRAEELSIIANPEAIAINQDTTEQGRRVFSDDLSEIWMKNLSNGKKAVLLLNRHPSETRNLTLNWADLGWEGKGQLRDVYRKKELGAFIGTYSVQLPPHTSQFILVKP